MTKVEPVEFSCATCGAIFSKLASQVGKTAYCSRPCYWQGMKGKEPHNKGQSSASQKPCAQCGIPIVGIPSDLKRSKFCSSACAGRARSGDTSRDGMQAFIKARCVKTESGCWEWTKSKNGGYGRFKKGERSKYAHRASYEAFVGQVPDGLFLDHLCRNRACVNPQHLEPVTLQENIRRGEAGFRSQTEAQKTKRSQSLRAYYADPANRERQRAILDLARSSEKRKKAAAEAIRTPERRAAASERMKEIWAERKRVTEHVDN